MMRLNLTGLARGTAFWQSPRSPQNRFGLRPSGVLPGSDSRSNRQRAFRNGMLLLFSLLLAPAASAQAPAAGNRIASRQDNGQQAPARAPFPPLSQAAEQQLDRLLQAWQAQSQGTKTLECRFQRWTYDMFAAPAGIHAIKSEGIIKYKAPDMGLFQVEKQSFFNGMKDGKPDFVSKPDHYGEHWVCNGEELIEFDHAAKECKIRQLPPELRGENIVQSPLPFVFNLDAQQIKERYWVRQVQSPKPGMVLIEAYPKLQEARAQYRLVQIALNEKTLLPEALLMYAPNFDAKKAPKWEHYEFSDVKRNSMAQSINSFMKNFINQRPPNDYKVFRDAYRPGPSPQMAGGESARR